MLVKAPHCLHGHPCANVLARGTRKACNCKAAQTSCEREKYSGLLDWATGDTQHAVAIKALPKIGRGLVAVSDIAPNEIILSVPFNKVYASKPEEELEFHWSVDMALRLLKDKQACRKGSQAKSTGSWCEWLAHLPSHVLTPLEFTDDELAAIGDEVLAGEVQVMQSCMEASYVELQGELQGMGYSYQDFLAAVQVLHSRCFFQPETNRHMAVPGIDMANHSPAPTAQVAVQHSPQAVQGLAAMEEVCDPSTLPSSNEGQDQSQFQLVAGHLGIREGEEVTISYGSMWPDAAYLLLFGFLPEGDNPRNICILFPHLQSLVACYTLLKQQAEPHLSLLQGLSNQVGASLKSSWSDAETCSNLYITQDGMDGRLPMAFQELEICFSQVAGQLLSQGGPTAAQVEGSSCSQGDVTAVTLHALLLHRAAEKALELEVLDEELQGASQLSRGMGLAQDFRQRQKALLQSFMSSASGQS